MATDGIGFNYLKIEKHTCSSVLNSLDLMTLCRGATNGSGSDLARAISSGRLTLNGL